MTYSRANTTDSDVDLIQKMAEPFYSKIKGLEHAIRFLRSSIGCLWVVDHQASSFLHETFQLPGEERDFFFFKDDIYVSIRVFHGIYKSESVVQVAVLNGCLNQSFLASLREAIVAYYGADEIFAINPVFEVVGQS